MSKQTQKRSAKDKAAIDAAWQQFKTIPPIRHWAEDLHALCCEIEKLPASEQQTKCSLMASTLLKDIEHLQQQISDKVLSDKQRNIMHYKNGREAKNGDKVVWIPASGPAVTGVLYDAVSMGDSCNGRIAITELSNPCFNLKECLHIDDIAKASIPDSH